MSGPTTICCGNCGTALDKIPPGAAGVYCPVCQFYNDLSERPRALAVSADALGSSLGSLVTQARAGGLADDEIVRVLREELEFAAELAQAGRQIFVQIVDLGPSEQLAPARPARTRALRGRVVGR